MLHNILRTKMFLLGFMNSKVAASILQILSPSMGFESGYLRKLPLIFEREEEISGIVKDCVAFSKAEWDSFEASWDFIEHPFITFERMDGGSPQRISREVGQHLGSPSRGGKQTVFLLFFVECLDEEAHECGLTRSSVSLEDEDSVVGVVDEVEYFLQNILLTIGQFDVCDVGFSHNENLFAHEYEIIRIRECTPQSMAGYRDY